MTRFKLLPLVAVVSFVGCSSEVAGTQGPSASSGGASSGGASSGGASSGGEGSGGASGGAPSGGAPQSTGGNTITGGSGPTGGSSTTGGAGAGGPIGGGDGSGGDGPTGGNSSGGEPGTGGSGPIEAKKSQGCGKVDPGVGSSGMPLTVSGHQYYVKLPSNYDENNAYPVVMMFNPTGNPITWAEQNAGYESTSAKEEAIRVYPHPSNSNNGWNMSDESFFEPFHEKVLNDYCVDENRVFVAGESSGGDFSTVIGCRHADKVRAIAPGAVKNLGGWFSFNPDSETCNGQVTAIVIHGARDNVVGTEYGEKTRDFYQAVNNCSMMEEPVEGYTDDRSNCVKFTGCDDGYDTYWCWHSDPTYSNTFHGWPAFAGKMTWEVFSSL